MDRIDEIKKELKGLHDKSADNSMRLWFFEGHVLVVADYAKEIAEKMGADTEVCILSALLHDVARTWGLWNNPELMNESLDKAEEFMKKYDYTKEQITQVKSAITCHSCKALIPHDDPGKILATADALAHLMTDFYFVLPYYGLKGIPEWKGYKRWAYQKSRRDFEKKIFYEEYKNLARPRYESIQLIFLEPEFVVPEE